MPSRNGQLLLFDAFPLLGSFALELLGGRRVGMMDSASGSAQTLTIWPRFPPSVTIASVIFSQGFWFAGSLVLAPFALPFLINPTPHSDSVPRGAPSREFHAEEIWTSSGFVSSVFFT